MLKYLGEPTKTVADFLGYSVVLAVLFKWAHVLLGVPAAIYACLRIYDWCEKRMKRKK